MTTKEMLIEYSLLMVDIFVLLIRVLCEYVIAFVKLFIPLQRKSICGDLVVLTGAGQGLGREVAHQLGALGAHLALLDINENGLNETKKELQRAFPMARVECFRCDISNEEMVNETFDKVRGSFKNRPIEILINNAALVNCKRIDQISSDSIRKVFEVNTLGAFWTVKAVLDEMKERNRGHIVNVASIAGLIGNSFLTDYCASKFALIGFADSLQAELDEENKENNIVVTSICPLAMRTTMFKKTTTRFENLLPVCEPTYVAHKLIDAILTEQKLVTVPGHAIWPAVLQHFMPGKVRSLIFNFLNYRVHSH